MLISCDGIEPLYCCSFICVRKTYTSCGVYACKI